MTKEPFTLRSLNKLFFSFCNLLLEIIFPKTEIAKKIEKISVEDFYRECKKSPNSLMQPIRSIFDYQDNFVRESVYELKYQKNRKVAEIFGQLLYEIILEEISDLEIFENFKNPILIPVPISKKRRRERGYNQIEILCEKIMECDSENLLTYNPNILKKVKNTKNQTDMKSRKARIKNLKECFEVSALGLALARDQGHSVILIDDVYTTGTTINECTKILKRFGFCKIIAYTVAH